LSSALELLRRCGSQNVGLANWVLHKAGPIVPPAPTLPEGCVLRRAHDSLGKKASDVKIRPGARSVSVRLHGSTAAPSLHRRIRCAAKKAGITPTRTRQLPLKQPNGSCRAIRILLRNQAACLLPPCLRASSSAQVQSAQSSPSRLPTNHATPVDNAHSLQCAGPPFPRAHQCPTPPNVRQYDRHSPQSPPAYMPTKDLKSKRGANPPIRNTEVCTVGYMQRFENVMFSWTGRSAAC